MPNDGENATQVTTEVNVVVETQNTQVSLLTKANEQSTLGLKKTVTFSELPPKKETPKQD